MITTPSLVTLGGLFQHCQHITDVNLSNNRLGGGAQAGGGERDLVDGFLLKFFTELWRPRRLDLSYNSFTDECLYPVIKYIFANHECKLEHFNLENNLWGTSFPQWYGDDGIGRFRLHSARKDAYSNNVSLRFLTCVPSIIP